VDSSDVVVVGGGVVGASLAYELATRGAQVTLVDADIPGRASDAGAGIVSPETLDHPDDSMFELGLAAAAHVHELIVRLATEGVVLDSSTFAKCGSLVVALDEHEDPWFVEVAERVTARCPQIVEVTPEQASTMFPPLARVWRALHNPNAARVDGRLLTTGLVSAAKGLGVNVLDDRAMGLEHSGDRVTAVRMSGDLLKCGSLALAGGAWSGEWAEQLRVELPVTPTKGQIVHVVSPGVDDASGAWPIVQPILDFYLVPWPGGRVACGGTFEADAGFDVRPTASGLRDLLREMLKIAPGLGQATVVDVRVGLRPTSLDDLPILGPVPGWENVHVCSGHGANGLMLGPYSGLLVAEGMLGPGKTVLDRYSLGRFVEGASARGLGARRPVV